MGIFGRIFDIQHFSVSDGPGIRTTVFFKGCPLRCAWCHNPESYIAAVELMFYKELCLSCGACVQACPNGCHALTDGTHTIDRTACTGCGACANACLVGALKTVGRTVSVDEVLREAAEDQIFYETSGGGLTLSGGEPMAQPQFALAIARGAKEMGISVCIETSGSGNSADFEAIAPYIDRFLFDYKVTGADAYRQHTGADLKRIEYNLRLLDTLGARIVLRCPMIPGVNITDEHAVGIIEIAKSLENLIEINLEPYHNIGVSKRERLGVTENADMIAPPEKAELAPIAARIEAETGIKTIVM